MWPENFRITQETDNCCLKTKCVSTLKSQLFLDAEYERKFAVPKTTQYRHDI